jgi:hypothetical protein
MTCIKFALTNTNQIALRHGWRDLLAPAGPTRIAPPITLGKRSVNLDVKLVSLGPGMHVTATTKTGEGFGSARSFLLTQIFYSGVI